jgi:eukaryotic-like serine/threonine-protein kinase
LCESRSQAEERGAHHPETLSTRHLHAFCLGNLERWEEALKEIKSVYAMRHEAFGLSDVQTVSTRSAQIGIEIAAHRNVVDHIQELRGIIDTLTAARGPNHQNTLIARYRLSRHLFQHGQVYEARAEIVDTIGHFDRMTDPSHLLLSSAIRLLDATEGHPISEKLTV